MLQLVSLIFPFFMLITATADKENYAMQSNAVYKVMRTVPTNESQLKFLQIMYQHADGDQCKEHNISLSISIPDVEKFLSEKQTRRSKGRVRRFNYLTTPYFDISVYHSYSEIQNYMRNLEKQYPHIAKVHTIGYTHENREINLIQIGRFYSSQPAIWIDAGIHAREWIAPSTALYIINYLVTRYDFDMEVQKYVNGLTWYILPVVNPDGYEFSRSSLNPRVRLWRKNRSPANCQPFRNSYCCRGVDLNRNFDFKWNQQGGSQDPCQETYSGRSAFSEPETQAIERFILQRADQLGAFVTLHSYSQIWMYPYGNQRYSYPKDVHDLSTVFCVILDPASGGSEDWAKAVAGIKYSFLVELRPEEDNQDGFILDESHIIPTGKETLEGIKEVAMVLLPGNHNSYFPNTDASSVCQDFHPMCKIWAVFGACLNDTEVRRLCVKSCELCSELDNQDEKLFIAIGAAESAKDIYGDADWLPGMEDKGAFASISRIMSKMKAQSFPLPENSVCQIGNANLPRTLLWRKGGKAAWLADPPLTTVGCNTAKIYAEGLVSANVLNAQLLGNCVYAAPNLRCVQTADIILKVVDPSGQIKIRIVPELEAESQVMDKNPCWYIKTDQFSAHNIHRVDIAHKSKKRTKDFSQRKGILDEIQRNHDGNVALFIVSDWKIKDLCRAICNCKISSENNAVCENRAISLLRIFFFKLQDNEWKLLNQSGRWKYMECFQAKTDQDLVLRKIEHCIFAFCLSLFIGPRPALYLPRAKEYALEMTTRNCHMFPIVLCLLSESYSLLRNSQYCTKRNLYYKHRYLFRSEGDLDRAIKAICKILVTPRYKLNILSSPKGLVLGDLVLQLGSTEIVDCNSISTIPTRSDEFQVLTTSATFILIVEKDSIFEKLAMEKANSVLRSAILITAKGYPDFPTRLFLRKLYDYLKLPMFALMDADPCGIEIFLTYKYGPMNVSYESGVNVLLPWMKWIGVYPSEISSLNLSDTQKLMLGIRERKLIYSLLNRFEASGDHFLISQLHELNRIGCKVEIEAICSISSSYLIHEYLKIKRRVEPRGRAYGAIAIALVKSYAPPSGEKRNCESNKDLIKSISSVQRGPNFFYLETLKYLADLSEVNILAAEAKITTTKTFHKNEFDSEKAQLDEIIAIFHGHFIRHSQIHIN
ncbi:Carboxypeptidase B [Trichinella nativa]|uniref:DNA topoisomerase (ATP-hydrolyzing) n=1 Tax=Trichinella nativa TaxID=6335 RepID=A0A0V1KZH2_9BILA|nr:Carboxypeptidase B [Trichinella nativa]